MNYFCNAHFLIFYLKIRTINQKLKNGPMDSRAFQQKDMKKVYPIQTYLTFKSYHIKERERERLYLET